MQHYPQGLTPRERLETDRWDPPQALWDLEAQYEEAHPDVDIEFVGGYPNWLRRMAGHTAFGRHGTRDRLDLLLLAAAGYRHICPPL